MRRPNETPTFPILASLKIHQNGSNKLLKALLDTGANANFISYSYLIKQGIHTDKTAMAQPIRYANGETAPCYGKFVTKVQVFDSARKLRTFDIMFHIIDIAPTQYQAILGQPWLGQADPDILLSTGRWRWRHQDPKTMVEKPTKFLYSMKDNPVLLVMYKPEIGSVTEPVLPRQYEAWTNVFSEEGAAQLPGEAVTHEIPTMEGKMPPWGPLYSLSQHELKTLREYLDKMLQRGWIRPSQSSAGAPVLFVRKPDGSLRLCVDYRGLNAITVKNRYPLPRIDELMDRLVNAQYFTKLDLRDAYHRIRIKRGDEWKTAFRTRYGHFEYMVMPFGLTNAPATFQSYINTAMEGILDDFCVVYLDDILIYSSTEEEHERHVKEVLERLRNHNLYAKLSKCEFHRTEVKFLGFIVGRGGVRIDPERSRTVTDWPEPKTYHDVQVFLGFTNYFRQFIPQYARITQPLTNLLKGMVRGRKKGPFEFPEKAREAFKEIKAMFTQPPVLRHFDPERPILLITGASGYAIAGILAQLEIEKTPARRERKRWRPVAFYSRQLHGAEQRYEVHDQELLAIVECFKEWRHYLEGSPHSIRVQTDHNNLRYFFKTKVLNQRQARWAELLAAYDFEIEYRPGRYNPADAPSRRQDYESGDKEHNVGLLPTLQKKLSHPGRCRTEADLPPGGLATPPKEGPGEVSGGPELLTLRVLAVEAARGETPAGPVSASLRQKLIEAQRGDARASQISQKLNEDRSSLESGPTSYTADWREESGVLLYKEAIYVPPVPAIRHEIMRVHHDDPWAGHYGHARTIELIRRKFWWEGLGEEVRQYVRSCPVCQKSKAPRQMPQGRLTSLPVPDEPWRDLAMDFIVSLPPSADEGRRYDAILVVIDRFSKEARYIPTTSKINAEQLADIFIRHIVCETGAPRSLVTDRGSLFTSKYWTDFCQALRIKRRLSTAFHPQTDGQTERQNQTLEAYLRAYCNVQQNDWVFWLPMAQFAYNNSKNGSTKFTPFMAARGTQPAIPSLENLGERISHVSVEERLSHLEKLREQLQDNLYKAQETQAQYYDQKHRPTQFHVGQKVLLSLRNISTVRPNKKLDQKYDGPFEIEAAVGKQAYRLRLTGAYAQSKIHPVFHVSLLKPYTERAGPGEEEVRPTAELIDGEEEWEVEGIIGERHVHGRHEFLVKWKGYPSYENSWEPISNLKNANEAVAEYRKTTGSAPKPRRSRRKQ